MIKRLRKAANISLIFIYGIFCLIAMVEIIFTLSNPSLFLVVLLFICGSSGYGCIKQIGKVRGMSNDTEVKVNS